MDSPAPQAAVQARGTTAPALKQAILEHLAYSVGKDPDHAVTRDWSVALSLAVTPMLSVSCCAQPHQDQGHQEALETRLLPSGPPTRQAGETATMPSMRPQ